MPAYEVRNRYEKVIATVQLDEDQAPLLGRRWYLAKSKHLSYLYYPIEMEDGKKYPWYLHRVVMGMPPSLGHGQVVDHINGDTMDNRRANLRIVTQSENMMNHRLYGHNKTGHTGVCPAPDGKRWRAYATMPNSGGKVKSLGFHDTIEAAASAVAAFKRETHGACHGSSFNH